MRNRTTVSIFILCTVLLASASVVQCAPDADGTARHKDTLNDLFADVVGHYPLTARQTGAEPAPKITREVPKNWIFDFSFERFVASNTSYEFGEPFPPFTKPLSRLEFPINIWWLNFDLRRTCPRWSIGGRAGFGVNRNSNGWMEDFDWDTDGNATFLTTYSHSYCDVRTAMLFQGDIDVNISDWLRLPRSLELRPLFMFRFQYFNLVAHDAIQWDYVQGTSQNLGSNGIGFRQDWYLYMIGLRGSYTMKMNKNLSITLKGEADWGPAVGHNEDRHLLRGERRTYEDTTGNALYFLTGIDMVVSKTVTMGVGVNYLGIRTAGTHRLWDRNNGVDFSWSDDVKAWSDQLGLTAHVSYAF